MSVALSKRVASQQDGPHRKLSTRIARYRHTVYRRPIAEHTRSAFAAVTAILAENPAMVVLDAGCGTGASTLRLAAKYPAAWVIGIDRSAHRLRKSGVKGSLCRVNNALLVRAELVDFWRLAQISGWRVERHYLLYPNPWPKPGQLRRRWHAHPIFPTVLGLGGRLELRTNWRTYVEEFAIAVKVWAGQEARIGRVTTVDLTPFERKYVASGHDLYRLNVDLRTIHG